MSKLLSLAILAVGVILIIYGVSASNSIGSSFSRMFTGAPTDKSVWLMVGGVLLTVVGLGGTLRGSRSS